jgi:hypothetical protein
MVNGDRVICKAEDTIEPLEAKISNLRCKSEANTAYFPKAKASPGSLVASAKS